MRPFPRTLSPATSRTAAAKNGSTGGLAAQTGLPADPSRAVATPEATELAAHAKKLAAFVANLGPGLSLAEMSGEDPAAMTPALLACVAAVGQQTPSARAQGGLPRLEALMAVWALENQLRTAASFVPVALPTDWPDLSTLSFEREAVATLRQLFDATKLDVWGLQERADAARASGAQEAPFRVAQALGAKVRLLGVAAGQIAARSVNYPSVAASNDVADKAAALVRKLAALDASLVPASQMDTFVPSPQATAALVQALPALPHSPPLLAAETLSKEKDAAGRTVRKHMRLSNGEQYVLGSKLPGRSGAHGAVALTQPLEGPPVKLLTKIQRTERKLRIERNDEKTATLVTAADETLARTSLSMHAIHLVDGGLLQNEANFNDTDGALRGLGSQWASTAIQRHFLDEYGKYYQIMPAMDGDLVDLQAYLAAQSDGAQVSMQAAKNLRTLVTAQLLLQLAGLHDRGLLGYRGFAHRDIKPGNILFRATGAVRLIDFDEALPLKRGGTTPPPFARQGSLVSPEMELLKYRPKNAGLGTGNDIWALGLALLDFSFAPDLNTLPFHNVPMGAAKAAPLVHPSLPMAAFVGWFGLQVSHHKNLVWPLPALDKRAQNSLMKDVETLLGVASSDAFKAQLLRHVEVVQDYFNARGTQDPDFTAFVLRKMLQPAVGKRGSAKALARTMLRKAQQVDDAARDEVVALFAGAADASPLAN